MGSEGTAGAVVATMTSTSSTAISTTVVQKTGALTVLPPPPDVDGYAPNPTLPLTHGVWQRWMKREGVGVETVSVSAADASNTSVMSASGLNTTPRHEGMRTPDNEGLLPHAGGATGALGHTAALRAQIRDLREELAQCCAERQRLQAALAAGEASDVLQVEIATLREQNIALSASLECARALQEASDSQVSHLAMESGYLKEKQGAGEVASDSIVADLRQSLSDAQEQLRKADAQSADVHARLAALHAEHEALKAEAASASAASSSSAAGVAALQDAEERFVRMQEANAALSQQQAEAEQSRDDDVAKLHSLQVHYDTCTEQLERTRKALDKREKEASAIKAEQLSERRRRDAQAEQLEDRLSVESHQLAACKADRSSALENAEQWHCMFQEAEEKGAKQLLELERLRAALDEREASWAAEARAAELRAAEATDTAAASAAAGHAATEARLREELQGAAEAGERARKELAKASGQLRAMEASNAALTDELNAVDERRDAELQLAREEAESLQEALRVQAAQAKAAKDRAADLEFQAIESDARATGHGQDSKLRIAELEERLEEQEGAAVAKSRAALARVAELERCLDEKDHAARQQSQEAAARIAQLDQRLADEALAARERVGALEAAADAAQRRLEHAEAEHARGADEARGRLGAAQRALGDSEAASAATLRDARAAAAELEAQLDDERRRAAAQQRELATKLSEAGAAREEQEVLAASQLKESRARVRELEHAAEQREVLAASELKLERSRAEELERRVADKEVLAQSHTMEVRTRAAELEAQLRDRDRELLAVREELGQNGARLRELEAQVSAARRDLDAAESAAGVAAAREAELAAEAERQAARARETQGEARAAEQRAQEAALRVQEAAQREERAARTAEAGAAETEEAQARGRREADRAAEVEQRLRQEETKTARLDEELGAARGAVEAERQGAAALGEEAAALRRKQALLSERVAELEGELDGAQRRHETLKAEHAAAQEREGTAASAQQARLAKNEEELAAARREVETLSVTVARAEAAERNRSAEFEASTGELVAATSRLQELKDEHLAAQARERTTAGELEAAQGELSSVKARLHELEHVEIPSLHRRYEAELHEERERKDGDYSRELQALQARIVTYEERIVTYRQEIETLTVTVTRVETSERSTAAEVDATKSELDACKARLHELEHVEIPSLHRRYEAELHEARERQEGEHRASSAQLGEASRETAALRARIAKYEEQTSKNEEELAAYRKEVETLAATVARTEAEERNTAADLVATRAELAAATRRLQDLKDEQLAAQARERTTASELQAAQGEHRASSAQLGDRIAQYEGQIASLRREIETLTAAVQRAETEKQEASQLSREMYGVLEEALRKTEAERADARAEVERLEGEAAAEAEKMVAQLNALERRAEEAEALQAELRAARDRVAQLQAELVQKDDTLARSAHTLADQQRKLHETAQSLSDASSSLQKLQADMDALQAAAGRSSPRPHTPTRDSPLLSPARTRSPGSPSLAPLAGAPPAPHVALDKQSVSTSTESLIDGLRNDADRMSASLARTEAAFRTVRAQLEEQKEAFLRKEASWKNELDLQIAAAGSATSALTALERVRAERDEARDSLMRLADEMQAHRGEIERLNALLAEAPSKEDAAELEAEYQERLAYLERSLKEAVDERTSLQRAREEEHLAMKQALEETRKVTSSTDTLNMDNEILKDEIDSLMTELEACNLAKAELEQAHATADLQLRQTAQEAEALRTALRQRQKAHDEEVRALRSRLSSPSETVEVRYAPGGVGGSAHAGTGMPQRDIAVQTLDLQVSRTEAGREHQRLRDDFEGKLRSIAFLANSRHLLVRDTHDLIRDFNATRNKAAEGLSKIKGLKVDRQSKRDLKEAVEHQRSTVEEMVQHEQDGRLIMDKYFTEWEKLHLGVGNKELPEPHRTDIMHVIARLHATAEEKDVIQQIAGLLVQFEKTKNVSPRRMRSSVAARTHSASGTGRTNRSTSAGATRYQRTTSSASDLYVRR